MKQFFGLALFLLSSAVAALGQSNTPTETPIIQQNLQELGNPNNISTTVRTFDLRSVSLRGTPLLLSTWTPGSVTLVNGKTVEAQFKYDVVNRVLLVLRNGKDSTQTAGYYVRAMTLTPANGITPMRFERLSDLKADVPEPGPTLVRVIYRGTYSLLQLPVRKFYKAPPRSPYGNNVDYNEFRDESVYYLVRPDGGAEKVKLSRKALASALQDRADAFGKIVKDQHLDVSIESDAARALASLSQ